MSRTAGVPILDIVADYHAFLIAGRTFAENQLPRRDGEVATPVPTQQIAVATPEPIGRPKPKKKEKAPAASSVPFPEESGGTSKKESKGKAKAVVIEGKLVVGIPRYRDRLMS